MDMTLLYTLQQDVKGLIGLKTEEYNLSVYTSDGIFHVYVQSASQYGALNRFHVFTTDDTMDMQVIMERYEFANSRTVVPYILHK